MSKKLKAKIRVGDRVHMIEGRVASTLIELDRVGERGLSSIEQIGPRLSHYIFIIRRELGIVVETVTEKHSGVFSGHHARYILRSPIEIIDVVDPRPVGWRGA